MKYYLQDSRSFTGNCMMWWRKNGAGYTSDLSDAWQLTEKEAFGRHKARKTDIPWPCGYIDGIAKPRADFQYADMPTAMEWRGDCESA